MTLRGVPGASPGTVPCPAAVPQRCAGAAGAARALGVPDSRGLARARGTAAALQSGCGSSADQRAGTSRGWGGSPCATGCTLLQGAPPALALFLPLLRPKPCCQDLQVPSSPIPHSPGGSGCKLAPMPSVTSFCVTHVPEIRSTIEDCHNKYAAVNLGRLSAIISPQPEGRETTCCNVLLFCYTTGLCNAWLSTPSKGGRPGRSLSARRWSRTAPAPSTALGVSCGSRDRFTLLAPGSRQGHVTCPCQGCVGVAP